MELRENEIQKVSITDAKPKPVVPVVASHYNTPPETREYEPMSGGAFILLMLLGVIVLPIFLLIVLIKAICDSSE